MSVDDDAQLPLIKDPLIAAVAFQPEQLTRARELKGITKRNLAEAVGKTPAAITHFEKGTNRPEPTTVERLAFALGVPVGFLARRSAFEPIKTSDCHFRTLRSASQNARRQAVRRGELLHELLMYLEKNWLELPEDKLSELRKVPWGVGEIEVIASEVRKGWGLGTGPIPDPIALLENKGIRVFPLSEGCDEVDAFSMWHHAKPLIMLSMSKPASRIHFDIAHELGHLVMHSDVGDGNAEAEANRFASAFLLPRESFIHECPTRFSLPLFQALKRRWYVSIQSLVVRGHALGKLSPSSYRNAFRKLSKLGLKKRESDEWEIEGPQVLTESLELATEEASIFEIADKLGIHVSQLRALL